MKNIKILLYILPFTLLFLIQDSEQNYYSDYNSKMDTEALVIQDFLKFLVNNALFPLSAVSRGYCLYQSVIYYSNENLYPNFETTALGAILLSINWKHTNSFISKCNKSLKIIENDLLGINRNRKNNWVNKTIKNKTIRIKKIKICNLIHSCLKSLEKYNQIEHLRQILYVETHYKNLYGNLAAEEEAWKTIKIIRQLLESNLLDGNIYNYLKSFILHHYINRIIIYANLEPISLYASIGLLNTMNRDHTLNNWILSASKSSIHQSAYDPVTNIRYDPKKSLKSNIYNFKYRTCIHVIWSSRILLENNEQSHLFLESSMSNLITFFQDRIEWLCYKLFTHTKLVTKGN
ncbi:uncharacterized protein CMU_038260 [Cryptosporidium muris RN66]|uniref:Uncharacterized protein n=1 Tax=Cryptosporidium muris (strain RN66) TaxID=441375 RepID=B6A969_CRYMR|nr:uncharacterized protein CMU_038260 [Cryptosporidium muris RN66]EEA04760.1 hypothetical protein, conserved [Cryptosporidium muris RN66]|eukprot:XP_002139109.1 hypothetical protein [Cryptosporidium muris RN66]